MGIDKGQQFIPVKDIPTVKVGDTTHGDTSGEYDVIGISSQEIREAFGNIYGDVRLDKSKGSVIDGREIVSYEQIDDYINKNGVKPIFWSEYEKTKYEAWSSGAELVEYAGISHSEVGLDSRQIREKIKNVREVFERLALNEEGSHYRVQLAHEHSHLNDNNRADSELKQIVRMVDAVVKEIPEYFFREPDIADKKITKFTKKILFNMAKMFSASEALAIMAEFEAASLDTGANTYSESMRLTELLENTLKTDNTSGISNIERFIEDDSQMDRHLSATMLLMFGEAVFDSGRTSLIDMGGIARTLSDYELLAERGVTDKEMVELAVVRKVDIFLNGGNAFVSEQERNRMSTLVRDAMSATQLDQLKTIQELKKQRPELPIDTGLVKKYIAVHKQ